jgi:hypothetical protein
MKTRPHYRVREISKAQYHIIFGLCVAVAVSGLIIMAMFIPPVYKLYGRYFIIKKIARYSRLGAHTTTRAPPNRII